MRKVWEWLKRNWKYLIFPLWAISLILVYVRRRRTSQKPQTTSGTSDQAADDASKAKDEAIRQIREKDAELAKKLEDKLRDASQKQINEFVEIKDRPLDEVAKWIDSIK